MCQQLGETEDDRKRLYICSVYICADDFFLFRSGFTDTHTHTYNVPRKTIETKKSYIIIMKKPLGTILWYTFDSRETGDRRRAIFACAHHRLCVRMYARARDTCFLYLRQKQTRVLPCTYIVLVPLAYYLFYDNTASPSRLITRRIFYGRCYLSHAKRCVTGTMTRTTTTLDVAISCMYIPHFPTIVYTCVCVNVRLCLCRVRNLTSH